MWSPKLNKLYFSKVVLRDLMKSFSILEFAKLSEDCIPSPEWQDEHLY